MPLSGGQHFYRLSIPVILPPQLSIGLAGANVTISWPTNPAGYALQQHTNLATTNWIAVTNIPIVANTQYNVTLPLSGGQHFYRLLSP